ncbi:mRNA-decapping enzyme 2, partial [Cyphomyrmex costatus]
RFFLPIPQNWENDLMVYCCQVEKAHWSYLDDYCTDPQVTFYNINQFAGIIFKYVPFLQDYASQCDAELIRWDKFKRKLPTYGAIIFNTDMTKVLLVQSYWGKNKWGFPKGRIDYNELPHQCAIREIWEETGFNITNMIDPNVYFESTIKGKIVRLYIIEGVSTETVFQPQTRQEIIKVDWFDIENLPVRRCKWNFCRNLRKNANEFSMVTPFVQ